MPAPTHQDREVEYCSKEKRIGFVVDKRPVANIGLASVGQTVHIEIFVIFAIGSGLLTGKVLLKPARKPKPCPLGASVDSRHQ